jgi:hypothetical protein
VRKCPCPNALNAYCTYSTFLPSSSLFAPSHDHLSPRSHRSLILAYHTLARFLSTPSNTATYLCLCFGFLLQIIYTYRPFFLRTLLHPSHSFFTWAKVSDRSHFVPRSLLTELLTFMPRVCSASPLKRDVRSWMPALGCWRRSEGRRSVLLQPHVGVCMCVWIERVRKAVVRGRAKSVRRSGRRRERGSMVTVWEVRIGGWWWCMWSLTGWFMSDDGLCAKECTGRTVVWFIVPTCSQPQGGIFVNAIFRSYLCLALSLKNSGGVHFKLGNSRSETK